MAEMDTPKQKTSEKKEEKRGGVPTLRDTTQTLKNPAFKIRDLSARTLVERFKQFRKKDLAFILAGLGVLFAAPLAEHYLMSPSHAPSDVFKEGWGFRPGVGGLGSGSSPFDTGETGFSPGSQVGESGDIITPANFRDPSSLILGPEAEAQAPATTSGESAPAASSSGANWKNALAEAGSGAGKAAMNRAGLPMPAMVLSKNMLSGLAGLGGGGSHASYSLPQISGKNVPNRPNVSNSLGAVKPNSNFQGVARSLTGNGTGSPEALKTAGANAASQFANPTAASGLSNAAAVQMPTANPGSAGGGGADKNTGQDSTKGSKTLGESLAFMAAKQNQQNAIDLQWTLAEKKAMMWPNIKEKMMTDMITKPIDAIADAVGSGMANLIGGPSGDKYCCSIAPPAPVPGPGGTCPANAMVETATACGTKSDPKSNVACANSDGTIERSGGVFACFKMDDTGGKPGGTSTDDAATSKAAVDNVAASLNVAAANCESTLSAMQTGGGTAAGSTNVEQQALTQICPAVSAANSAAQKANTNLGASQ